MQSSLIILFSLKSSLKVAYAYELLQQLPEREEVERESEREHYILMVLASAYSPSLQMRLICCLWIPVHQPQEAVAVQPCVAFPVGSCLELQDRATRVVFQWAVLSALPASQAFLPLSPGIVLPWR